MTHGKTMSFLSLLVPMFLASGMTFAAPEVATMKMPRPGFRPQVIRDGEGTIHLVYASLEKRGDLLYTRKKEREEEFSEPIKVNSTPGCAAAFNMAVGKKGRVHVLIRPNAIYSRNILKRKLKFIDLKYMLYCRMNDQGTRFEKERDLAGETFGFEGVGALIPDGKGTLYAFWHGLTQPGPESTRQVFMAKSENEGRTFAKTRAIQGDVKGACACCSMHGTMDAEGNLYVGYRNSEASLTKDSYLLTSRDGGKTFTAAFLDPWANAGCPGAIYSLTSSPSGVYVAWSTLSQVYFSKGVENSERIAAPIGKGKKSRSPVLVANAKGDVLFAWSEAANARQFMNGGDLAWQVYDRDGKPIAEKRVLPASVARWSFPAAYATADGDFVIIYDGPGSE